MNSTFNGQILVEKLAKLNNSQQSIETLSHWCIFHRRNAKQVVETWDRQFHCAPREQRVSFLYLANDILQNSRRRGLEFVTEFWKVLPGALNDALENGDEFSRNATMRLIDIWEERKVFGLRPQTLREEFLEKNAGSSGKNGRSSSFKAKPTVGDGLEKIISSYGTVYDGPIHEDTLFSKCRTVISYLEKVEKEMANDRASGKLKESSLAEELQGQKVVLKECIEQLGAAESSRAALVSHLKEALREQETKLDQVRDQLKTAKCRFDQASSICQQLVNGDSAQLPLEQTPKQVPAFSGTGPAMGPLASCGDREHTAPVMQTGPSTEGIVPVDDDSRKTAAAVAARLASSTSSAQMLTYVLSLASEGAIGNPVAEGSTDHPSEKKPKLENGLSPPYVPLPSQPPPPPFPHPDSLHHKVPSMSQVALSSPPSHTGGAMLAAPPLPPTPPPLQPPPPPSQFVQAAGTMTGLSYNHGNSSLQPPLPGYPMAPVPVSGLASYPPPNPYQNFHASESGFYNQPPLPAGPPISRQ
ncbi:Regulation of nuclear pre-mRNA domain-containing protein 1B [Nymphaea thermarum]|nr:Regulation of nuclear pre-mRNA domain-containing protein 1B [Nymphaea thermarum]